MRKNIRNVNVVAIATAAVLLVGLAVEAQLRPRPSEAEPYHRSVREAIESMPMNFPDPVDGPWVGKDRELPQAAIRLLKPNKTYSRVFRNSETGQQVSVLIVHCSDARDLYGHYPPVCYPAHGQEERSREAMNWQVGDKTIPGMAYEFRGRSYASRLLVHNFILVPGEIGRDMQALDERIGDFTRRFYGAAQVQIVFGNNNLGPAEREQITEQMIRYHMPIIEAIRSGDGK